MATSLHRILLASVGLGLVVSSRVHGTDLVGMGLPVQKREILVDHRYLNVPVRTGAPRRTISITVGGRVVRAFEVELAEDAPDFWAFTEMTDWMGSKATLQLEPFARLAKPEIQERARAIPPKPGALEVLRLEDNLREFETLYREPLRPLFHFSTRRGWLNDPHGPVFYHGAFHLFYQHQPFSMTSAMNSDKYWGHAISQDLVHWEELPVALAPDRDGGIWSGSAVIDFRNDAGFQRGRERPLLLFYTSGTGRSALNPDPNGSGKFVQSVAFTNDGGTSWEKYSGNPVLPNITPLNRDPLVFWHAPSRRWVMVLYVGYPISNPGNQYTAQIFNSENLKDWTYQSRIEGFFDCPMLFEIPLDGDPGNPRWVIHCANMKYRIGRFDGKTFTPETELIDAHCGKTEESAYAPSMVANMPGGRHVQIAWLYKKDPAAGVRQILTFPSELSLVSTQAGPRLKWQPIRELEKLRGRSIAEHNLVLPPEKVLRWPGGPAVDVELKARIATGGTMSLTVHGLAIKLSSEPQRLELDGYIVPMSWPDGVAHLRILLDRTSVEIFGDTGLTYLPLSRIAPSGDESISLMSHGLSAEVPSLEIHELNSIWPHSTNLPQSP